MFNLDMRVLYVYYDYADAGAIPISVHVKRNIGVINRVETNNIAIVFFSAVYGYVDACDTEACSVDAGLERWR